MKVKHLCIVALALVAFVPSSAQTMKSYSTFTKNGAAPDVCKQEAAVIRPLLTEFQAPQSWTWVVVCDEPSWSSLAMRLNIQEDPGGTILAETDIVNHYTFIRGYKVLHPISDLEEAQPRHVIAHELGHILANTHDEGVAERRAEELLRTHLASR